ncbi:sulfurtransferase [Verticiella sediminum]|uniref:Sulfurtransferase n=1 Tax=Verticiella sediminum TaxID=1247510 RepID=A0A556B0X7_9BURK|nr:sulfurtransferase [Verticiella sediminum]TSH98841.1 sulfurtransferase [Verticiella sediminum]
MQPDPAPLVSPQELQHLDVRVVDCSHDLTDPQAGTAEFLRGHVPGAVHAHLDQDLSGTPTGRNGRHPLPSPQAFAAWLGRQGIGPDTQVVAYDRAGGMYAARLWWLLRWVGHERARVLDGGWQAWLQAGLPVQTEVQAWPAAAPAAARADDARCVDVQQVLANLQTRQALVVDARGAGRFAGIGETIDPRAGHIPGAKNRPYTDNLDASGRFKPADELTREWRAVLGDTPSHAVIAQCGSGVTACHNLLAMEIAGLPGARLYPGSWSEWCSDPQRPIRTGPQP